MLISKQASLSGLYVSRVSGCGAFKPGELKAKSEEVLLLTPALGVTPVAVVLAGEPAAGLELPGCPAVLVRMVPFVSSPATAVRISSGTETPSKSEAFTHSARKGSGFL